MKDVRRHIVEVLRARREHYVETCERLISMAPPDTVRGHNSAAARQMTDGHLTLLVEALEGRGNEMRSMYLEGLIPALAEGGVPLRGLVGGTVQFSMLIMADVARHIAPEDQVASSEWFAAFYAEYITELASLVMKVLPK